MTKKNEVGRREFLKDMTLAGAMAAVVPARPSPLPGMSPGGLLQANRGGRLGPIWTRLAQYPF